MRVPWNGIAAGLAALLVAGCAIELQNVQPAQELARQTRPPGSPYLGWRIFQERCATCHGETALGSERAPNLLPRLREMGPRRFVGLVLDRYDWTAPPGLGREAAIEQILQRKDPELIMPAWAGEPRVSAHIVDLYAYLSGRADGSIGTGKPTP